MKKICSLISSLICICILSSCSDEADQLQTRSSNDNPYAVYFERASSKPELSLLDIGLGYKSVEDLNNYNLVFTEKDADLLYDLSPEELVELKNSIMKAQGVSTEEEMEKIVDDLYEKFCDGMDEDELRKLNTFGEQYLTLPAGYSSFSMVYPYEMAHKVGDIDLKYLQYAIAIDNIAKPILKKFGFSSRSQRECEKYLGIRLLITSVSFCCSCILPGGGILGVYVALYDALDAALMYKNCLRTRGIE